MITAKWAKAIDRYALDQRLAGYPETTIRARREHLQHLARRVERGPWKLDKDDLREYAGAQTWAPETRRGRRNTFRSFWTWGIAEGYTDKDPSLVLPKVRPTPALPRPIPEAIYQPALLRAPERTALILRLAHDAGMRRAEIAVSHSDDLFQDLVGWSLVVHGKGNKKRIVPLTPRLAFALLALGDGPFFPGAIAGHLSPRRVGELADDALPGKWTIHNCRHSFATNYYRESGGDVFGLQDLLGHANPNTTRRYTQIDTGPLRAAVNATDQAVNLSLTANPRTMEGAA